MVTVAAKGFDVATCVRKNACAICRNCYCRASSTLLPSSGGSPNNHSNSKATMLPRNVAAHNIVSLAKRDRTAQYLYIHVHIHICIYIYIYVYTNSHLLIHMPHSFYLSGPLNSFMSVVYIYTHTCTCTHIYVYVHVYTDIVRCGRV